MKTQTEKGILYLIPTPISSDGISSLSVESIEVIHALRHFIVENARTARRFIKTTSPPYAIAELQIAELDKHSESDARQMLSPALEGLSVGLMSEAGCPAVGDPGSEIVRLAHTLNISVRPLAGPSSILLALMASGMNGQKFTFHGYLSAKRNQLLQDLRQLEVLARKQGATQIFIEAPYRNRQVMESCLEVLHDQTELCVACDLSSKDEYVRTLSISKWQNTRWPELHKRPTIFLISSAK